MRSRGYRRILVFVAALAIWCGPSFGEEPPKPTGTPAAPALPLAKTGISAMPRGSYVLAVDGRSSRTVVLDTASHTVHVFDRRGREDVAKRLQASPTFTWDFVLSFAADDGGDRLAMTTSGGIALFTDFTLDRVVPLDRPPSVAMDMTFARNGDLLFSRMVPGDPALFGVHDPLTLLARVDDDGQVENVAFPIEPDSSQSYMKWTSQRQLKIASDDSGAVWVADAMAYRIRKLDAAGHVLETVESPDERSSVEDDPNFKPGEGHGTDLAGGGARPAPRGEAIVSYPVIRDLAATGGYLWVLVRDDTAPGGERLDVVLPGEELRRFSLPLPDSLQHERFLGVTRRFVVLCPADAGHPVTLDRDEIERMAEKQLFAARGHDRPATKTGPQPSPSPRPSPAAPATTPKG